MATATISSPGLANIDSGVDIHENALQEEHQKRVFDSLVAQGRSQYRQAMQITKSITERDAKEFEENSYDESKWNALNARTYEKRIEMMSDTIHKYTPELIRETCDLETDYFTQILDAEQKGWIDKASVDWWKSKLESKTMTHFQKRAFMEKEFPQQIKNCRKIAEDRKDVADLAKKKGLTSKQIPELAEILDAKKFLSFPYRTRLNKVGKAKALILAYEKNQEIFIRSVEKELDECAKAGWMHPTKTGQWMHRVMESDNPDAYAKSILRPCVQRWRKAREYFDVIHSQFKRQKGASHDFEQISENTFLLSNYAQRIEYIEKAKTHLKVHANEKAELASLYADIQRAINTTDWEKAEYLLSEAMKTNPDDMTVCSMARHVHAYGKNVDQPKNPENINEKEEIYRKGLEAKRELKEDLMPGVYSKIREDLEWGLNEEGPVAECVADTIFNRHWVIANGFSTPALNEKHGNDEVYHQQTKERIANGHDWQHERNIIKGETANVAGIRDECAKPQEIFTDERGKYEVREALKKNADNRDFRYMTSYVNKEVPYVYVREFATNYMYRIKKNAKLMREAGINYSAKDKEISPAIPAAREGSQAAKTTVSA